MISFFKKTKKLSGFLVFFSFLSYFIVLFSDVVFGGRSFVRRDIGRFYYPMWKYASERMASGDIPLWNPHANFGCPFFANIQTCVFYPPTALFYLSHFALGFNLYILLHLAAAGFFTWLWMRENGASRAASTLAGFTFSMGGYMMSTVNLTISLCTAALFPLALVAYRRALRSRGFFWKGLAAAALALQCLAGDPAVFYASVIIIFLFSAYRSAEDTLALRRLKLGALSVFAVVVGVFACLAAFQILPFGEEIVRSIRLKLRADEAMMWSMQYNDIFGIVVPYFSDLSMYVMDYWSRQSWLENYYVGASATVMAFFAAVYSGRRNVIHYHTALAALGLAMSLGGASPLYAALHRALPLLGFVRYPVRFYFLFSFALACLAGFGFDRVWERSQAAPRARTRWAAAAVLAGSAMLVALSIYFEPWSARLYTILEARYGDAVSSFYSLGHYRQFIDAMAANVRRSLFFMAFAAAGFCAVRSLRPARVVTVIFLCGLVFADLSSANVLEPRVDSAVIESPSKNVRVLLEDRGFFRVLASPRTIYRQVHSTSKTVESEQEEQKDRLTSNYLLLFGIDDALGYDSIYLSDTSAVQARLMNLKAPLPSSPLDWLNVGYVASPLDDLGPSFRLVNRTRSANLFRNERCLPRAFLAERAIVEKDPAAVLDKVCAPGYDARKVIYVDSETASETPEPAPGGKDALTLLFYGPESVGFEAEAASARWLFLSDAYYPGWKAWVDGRPTPIVRANGAFRAVRLEPGYHRIFMKYDPWVLKIGVFISAIAAAALIFYYLMRARAYLRIPL